MRDEQILSALNELDRYRELLREEKNYLEECLKDENKDFIVNFGKTATNLCLLIGKAFALCFGVIFALAYINSLGLSSPYVFIAKGVPLGIENYYIFFHKHKYPFKVKFTLKNRGEVICAIKEIDECISMMDKAYNELFSQLSLKKMEELVSGFEYNPSLETSEYNMIPPKVRSKKVRI